MATGESKPGRSPSTTGSPANEREGGLAGFRHRVLPGGRAQPLTPWGTIPTALPCPCPCPVQPRPWGPAKAGATPTPNPKP